MNLARHSLDNESSTLLHSVAFTHDQRHFVALEESGYSIWKTHPLKLLRKRELNGTLTSVIPLPHTSLLALQGGGSSPLHPPNKVVIYNDAIQDNEGFFGRPIASLEFKSAVRGLAARNGNLFVVLSGSAVSFEYGMRGFPTGEKEQQLGITEESPRDRKGKGREMEYNEGFWIQKKAVWKTCENDKGLIAVSTDPGSSLLALPGRQFGHVQLIQLDSCPVPPEKDSLATRPAATNVSTSATPVSSFRTPILVAHTHPLSIISCSRSGSTVVTASTQGTLLRTWDVETGRLDKELKRGIDKADVWGIDFPPSSLVRAGERVSKGEKFIIVGWSEKGTIHIWGDEPTAGEASNRSDKSQAKKTNIQKIGALLDPHISLPRYFRSQPSSALFRLSRQMSSSSRSQQPSPSDYPDLPFSERFVVAWVDTHITDSPETLPDNGKPTLLRMGSGASKASRGLGSRRGSASTVDSPNDRLARKSLRAQAQFLQQPPGSPLAPNDTGRTNVSSGSAVTKHFESLQLVAITFSGGWYRIAIPDSAKAEQQRAEGELAGKSPEGADRQDRCTLMEYRKMTTAVGGW